VPRPWVKWILKRSVLHGSTGGVSVFSSQSHLTFLRWIETPRCCSYISVEGSLARLGRKRSQSKASRVPITLCNVISSEGRVELMSGKLLTASNRMKFQFCLSCRPSRFVFHPTRTHTLRLIESDRDATAVVEEVVGEGWTGICRVALWQIRHLRRPL
jgi:hypothetical protein